MRSWTRSVYLLRRSSLRRIFFAALAVALALPVEVPMRVAAQSTGTLNVTFSQDTLPITSDGGGAVLCRGQLYKLLVQGASIDRNRGPQPIDEIITATAALNPISPDRIRRRAFDPAAIFSYNAKEKGRDAVEFGATELLISTNGTRPIGYKNISLEVRECTYKVTFVSHYQFAQGGVLAVNFGYMADTRIERKEDGTFAGNGPIVLSNLVSSPVCTEDYSEVVIPDDITGNLLQDSRELELTFTYRKGTMITDATCPRVGTKQTSTAVDISAIAPRTVKFPQEGGARSFPLPGPGRGNVTILVNQQVTSL